MSNIYVCPECGCRVEMRKDFTAMACVRCAYKYPIEPETTTLLSHIFGRDHDINSLDCWCKPTFFIPCDNCDPDESGNVTGCFKCDEGKIEVTYEEANARNDVRIIIVHNE